MLVEGMLKALKKRSSDRRERLLSVMRGVCMRNASSFEAPSLIGWRFIVMVDSSAAECKL